MRRYGTHFLCWHHQDHVIDSSRIRIKIKLHSRPWSAKMCFTQRRCLFIIKLFKPQMTALKFSRIVLILAPAIKANAFENTKIEHKPKNVVACFYYASESGSRPMEISSIRVSLSQTGVITNSFTSIGENENDIEVGDLSTSFSFTIRSTS